MSGWFAVKRGITKHPIFKGHPERLAIWIWLIDNACWQEQAHDIKGKTAMIQRGQVCVSLRRLAEDCGVSVKVVRGLLDRLKAESMVGTDTAQGRTIITLCNYDKYQAAPKPEGTARAQQGHTNKQGNNLTSSSLRSEEGAASPAPDPAKIIFDAGRKLLTDAGIKDRSARSMLGKWRKEHGDAKLIEALGIAQRDGAIDPVGKIQAIFRHERQKPENKPVAEGFRRVNGVMMRINNPKLAGATHENRFGNAPERRDSATHDGARESSGDVPELFPFEAEENHEMPLRNRGADKGSRALSPLWMELH